MTGAVCTPVLLIVIVELTVGRDALILGRAGAIRRRSEEFMSRAAVVLLALLAAAFMALGIVIRQRATMDVPQARGVGTAIFAASVRKPLWWAGTAAGVTGYVCQGLALTNGSLMLVQPLLVSSLLFALPISARLAHRRVTGLEWAWALLLTVALAVFVVVARANLGNYPAPVAGWATATVVVTLVVVGCVAVAARSGGRRRAVLLAVAVAALFGVINVLLKISVNRLTDGGLPALLGVPAPYLLVVLAVVATVLQQSAFHAGALQTTVPTMLVLERVVAVVLGAAVLGEQLAMSGAATVALPTAVVAMVAATIALGRHEGAFEEVLEAEVTRRSGLPPGAHDDLGPG
jgi:drug/metabolite transporter (DMT)-like permease